jgi:lipopolysaccharide exporter
MNIKNLKIVQSIKKFIKKIVTPGDNLSEKMIKGSFWVFTLRIADRIFQLAKTIILARLLSPNDFGMFAIALLVLSIFGTFTQTGSMEALIQKKGETESYLNTAWTIGLIRGFFITVAVFFLAKPAAIFFATPDAELILRIIGISIVLQSLNNIAVLYFQKELEFQKFFKYQFLGTIADVAVAITAVFLLKSVWALVLGMLAGDLVRCIMSYVINSFRPRLQFNWTQARELFRFGKWIAGTSILIFLIINGDDIFVGKFLGVVMLGFYQMAYKISNTPTTEITLVISQVSFPVYSKLQDDLPRLRDAFMRVLKLTAFISFPLAAFILILAPEFTLLFLGEKWMPIVPAMRILVMAGALRSLVASTCSIFRAIGKPRIETMWQIIRFIIIVILIYPLTDKYGISGTSAVILLSTFISGIGFGFEILRTTRCGIKNLSKLVILPFLNGIIIVGIIYAMKFWINASTFLGFFSLTAIGLAVFFGITCLFDRYLNYGIFVALKKGLGAFKN